MEWLKEPEKHFDPAFLTRRDCGFDGGVCVGAIAGKSGLAQSVISGYLLNMQKSGLLESKRYCQYTYYRRNENGIAAFKESILKDL